jgi:enoyl-CoA hydratase/carnithine racemase
MSTVTVEKDGHVLLIGVDRAAKRNAWNLAVIEEVGQAYEQLATDDDVRVGVVFGHGDHFCAGLDLAQALARANGELPKPRNRQRHAWHTVFDQIARGPIPFVAALRGAVVGGGLELATAAHVRVADETAFFGLPEGQRGIFVGGGGTVRIQRVVGYSVMADMMLTGRILTVREAEAVHIVRYVVAPGEALAKARELALKIAGNTPDTNWKITNVLPRVNDLSHDDGLFMEYLTTNMAKTGDSAERLREFVEGRAQPLVPGLGKK